MAVVAGGRSVTVSVADDRGSHVLSLLSLLTGQAAYSHKTTRPPPPSPQLHGHSAFAALCCALLPIAKPHAEGWCARLNNTGCEQYAQIVWSASRCCVSGHA